MILSRFMPGALRSAERPAAEAVADAFERPELDVLFRQHAKDVHRMISRMLGPGASAFDVEDLTQHVFLAAHRSLDRFRGTSKPKTWLCGIAARTVYKEIRGRARHRRMIAGVEQIMRASPDTSNRNAGEVRAELVRAWRSVLELSPKKRIVFVLHDIEGMSGREIAEALEIREGTVHTRLYHARRELAALLEKGRV